MTDQTHSDNPLLTQNPLPAFGAIRPEHIEPAVREVLAAQRRALAEAETVDTPTLEWLRDLEHINTEIHRVCSLGVGLTLNDKKGVSAYVEWERSRLNWIVV